ncbi:hypothetical protein BAE44_0022999 [Dichanthelium oligosanthes]|uniref:Uncharacterized protein n=1 Tax=Dichanthelium oligosanthes TaxID=888268 RepID=A0A1E5USY9_9POAL|nr:hypothetical protein BAE44_0022999 [Dichanthelium oligosanthes]
MPPSVPSTPSNLHARRPQPRRRLERQRSTAILPPPRASSTTSIAWWNHPTAPAGKHARAPRPRNGSASPSPGCLAASSPPTSGGGSAGPGDPAPAAEQPDGPCRSRDDEATMRATSSSALQPERSIVRSL